MCQLSFHCCSKTSSGTCHPVLHLCYFPEKEKTVVSLHFQRAKKVVSDSFGLVDFAIGIVFFVLNLPDGQVLFSGGNSTYRRIVINPANQKGFWG